MKPTSNGVSRAQRTRSFQGDGPNWLLIAGSALLSTLSIRLGYKLKQALDKKQQANTTNENEKSRRQSRGTRLHSNVYTFTHEEDGCFSCLSGNHGESNQLNHHTNGQMLTETEVPLPLVTVPGPEFIQENGVMWSTSPDRLDLPPKPFHHSNCSDSPRFSESGSDIFVKREVIQKLRHQVKRRDDMILEMQDQILELQISLKSQMSHASHLQSQFDATNRDMFDSEREIQRLRKAIADHCVGQVSPNEKSPTSTIRSSEGGNSNGQINGFLDGTNNLDFSKTERGGDDGKIDMLKTQVGELKEVIERKDYLLQSYKEQKTVFSMKIKELQQKLDFQQPNTFCRHY